MNGARDYAFSEQKNPKILKITRVDCSRHVLELIPSTWRKVTQKAWCKWGKNMTLSLISACFGIKYLGRIPPSGRVDDSRVDVIPFDSEVWGGFNNWFEYPTAGLVQARPPPDAVTYSWHVKLPCKCSPGCLVGRCLGLKRGWCGLCTPETAEQDQDSRQLCF